MNASTSTRTPSRAKARLVAELADLNAELDSFSYSVSHDLRAPVRAVLGFARSVAEDYGPGLDDEGRRKLAVVQSEAVRLGEMIDALLTFSRLGREQLESVPVDMTSLVHEVIAEQIDFAGRPQWLVEVSHLPAVRGDPVLLRQVWVNVLSNAVKYTREEPSPRLAIWGARDGPSAVFHVSDNGVGFDVKYADKLFGIFQTLHRREELSGIGTGLALSKRIVHRHGGTMWADAGLGTGATFSFALPIDGVPGELP